jgi:single-strand DNA-binding protein
MYLNKVLLYGNLTRDPEVKALPGGQQVASFSIATNRSYKDKNGIQQEQVEYHNIAAFGRTAEVMGQYLKKGRPVFVEGRLQTRSWEADGKKNYRTEIIVDSFQFGADAGRGAGSGSSAPSYNSAPAAPAPSPTGMPELDGGEGAFTTGGGSEIAYPDEEINPDDIPF